MDDLGGEGVTNMTGRFVTVLGVVWLLAAGLPPIAAGQTIHGDPQKAAYASPAEWPTISSQCHWLSPNLNSMGAPAHTHVDMKFPLYAEVNGPFTVPFSIIMFHTDGRVTDLIAGYATSLTLNGQPILSHFADDWSVNLPGDPMGVVTYTGTVTFDLSLGFASGGTKHGYQPVRLRAATAYQNGEPVYSAYDLTLPESKPGDGTGIRTLSNCEVREPILNEIWQSNVAEFLQILPVLGPITPGTPWVMRFSGYNYGASKNIPPGTLEVRYDADIHNGIPGTTIFSVDGTDTTIKNVTLPDNVPDGLHKLMWRWNRPNFGGDKELDSILVFNVTVGPGGVAQPPNLQPISPPPPPPPPPPQHPVYHPLP
jgi:hypothetical protein